MVRWFICFIAVIASAVWAEEDPALVIGLDLSRAVPYRVLAKPEIWQLVVEFEGGEVPDMSNLATADPRVLGVALGVADPGWTRLSLDLVQGYDLQKTAMTAEGRLWITLVPVTGGQPVIRAGPSGSGATELPLIVLDPGHGGIDGGAVRGAHKESDLMLLFAGELAEALIRSGRFRVDFTRSGDSFLRLSQRIDIARKAGADAFLSLHADALLEGRASGAAVFTLSDEATDAAAQELVEAHDRADLLMGQDLQGTSDEIATILIDMAQRDTRPRSEELSRTIVAALAGSDGSLRKQARQSADFGVLKAPDVPSVLIELGFMSDEKDLKNLLDPEWRARTAEAIRDGLVIWADEETAKADLRMGE